MEAIASLSVSLTNPVDWPMKNFGLRRFVHLANTGIHPLRLLDFFICMCNILLRPKTDFCRLASQLQLKNSMAVSSTRWNNSGGCACFSPVCLWPLARGSQNTEVFRCLLNEWVSENPWLEGGCPGRRSSKTSGFVILSMRTGLLGQEQHGRHSLRKHSRLKL